MKKLFFVAVNLLLLGVCVFAQRKLTEATITYSISIKGSDQAAQLNELLKGASSVVYLKGQFSRMDMNSPIGAQSTIIDGKSGSIVMLKGFGDQKYLIKMTQDNWQDMNKSFDRISFSYENETKTIAGHLCKKATAKLPDGKTFTVYYAPDLIPVNKDFQYMNRSLPGLAMEYEASMGALLVTYSVASINMNPVPQAKFDIPTTGYRVMTYEESRRGGK